MPNPIEIIINSKATGSGFDDTSKQIGKLSDELVYAKTRINEMGQSAYTQAAKTTSMFGDTAKATGKVTEAAGMSRREWMRTGSEAAYYMTSAIGKTGELGRGISQTTGMVTQLGESFMFGGVVGVGIAAAGLAISYLISQQQEATKYSRGVEDALVKQNVATSDLGKVVQEITGLTGKESDAWAEAAKTSDVVSQSIRDQAKAHEALIFAQQTTWKPTGSANPSDFGITEMSDAMAAYSRLTDATRWQAQGERYLQNQTQQLVDTQKELGRVMDLRKANIPLARAEIESYTAAMTKMGQAHNKAQAGFAADVVRAETNAAKDRLKIETDTNDSVLKLRAKLAQDIGDKEVELASRIVGINADLLTRLGDMEIDRLNQNTDAYYDYSHKITAIDYDRTQAAADQATARNKLEADLQAEFASITEDESDRIAKAKTLDEVARIKADAENSRKLAKDKIDAQQLELDSANSKKKKELEHRKELVDEEYRHETEIKDRDAALEVSRAQQTANAQISEAKRSFDAQVILARRNADQQVEATREQETKQLAAAKERTAAEIVQIRARAADEAAGYRQSLVEANTAHTGKMANLRNEQTELERLRDDLTFLEQHGWTVNVNVLGSLMNPWNSFVKPVGWYAGGGDFTVDRPTVIGVGEAGRERVQITPAGKSPSGGARTYNIVINYPPPDLTRGGLMRELKRVEFLYG